MAISFSGGTSFSGGNMWQATQNAARQAAAALNPVVRTVTAVTTVQGGGPVFDPWIGVGPNAPAEDTIIDGVRIKGQEAPPADPGLRYVQVSTYGVSIPLSIGKRRLAGNIIDAEPLLPKLIGNRDYEVVYEIPGTESTAGDDDYGGDGTDGNGDSWTDEDYDNGAGGNQCAPTEGDCVFNDPMAFEPYRAGSSGCDTKVGDCQWALDLDPGNGFKVGDGGGTTCYDTFAEACENDVLDEGIYDCVTNEFIGFCSAQSCSDNITGKHMHASCILSEDGLTSVCTVIESNVPGLVGTTFMTDNNTSEDELCQFCKDVGIFTPDTSC